MRARITLAVVAIVVGALTFAGLIGLVLERRSIETNAKNQILQQTVALTTSLRSDASLFENSTDEAQVLAIVRKVAGFTSASALVVERAPKGPLVALPVPPSNIDGALDLIRLARGEPSDGAVNGVAFAAAKLFSLPAASGGTSSTVVLLLENSISYPADAPLYFLLAGVIALVAAAVVAAVIANRISRRVIAASMTATLIAGGDLDARVETRRNDYPELAGLGASLNAMASELGRARHLEREFLMSISHDLRTPLTSIRGYSEAIADHAVTDPAQAAEIVVREAQRLERLIGDLLDLARLDARQFSLHLAPLDAGTIAADAADALRYEFEASAVGLEVTRPRTPMTVEADPDRIAQIVANLTENALKFARTTVSVRTESDPDLVGFIRIVVEDDGPGIDPVDLPHIFERLFTSTRLSARAAGTGLGLAIVAELSEAMGGDVRTESPLGTNGGTRISVRLPRIDPERRLFSNLAARRGAGRTNET